ncbi:MAG: hypothetical protein L0I24_16170 [Pseudonocardia sp.]|nr:hypothetical protein [Pseudonocardia sp.]
MSLETARTRASIGSQIVGPHRYPQLVLRVGRAQPDAPDLPTTPRRGLADAETVSGTRST